MKTGATLAVAMAGILMFAGCTVNPDSVSRSTNPEVAVDKLFTSEGCTIYRFADSGSYHYFAKCTNHVETMTDYTTVCGKGCVNHHHDNIRTESLSK